MPKRSRRDLAGKNCVVTCGVPREFRPIVGRSSSGSQRVKGSVGSLLASMAGWLGQAVPCVLQKATSRHGASSPPTLEAAES